MFIPLLMAATLAAIQAPPVAPPVQGTPTEKKEIREVIIMEGGPQGRPGQMRRIEIRRQGDEGMGQFPGQARPMTFERMAKQMNLSEAQTKSIQTRWDAFTATNRTRMQKNRELTRKIQDITRGPESMDQKNLKLKPLVEEWMTHRREHQQARLSLEKDLMVGLTPYQQMRLTIGLEALETAVRNRVGDAMQKRGRNNRPMGPGRPNDGNPYSNRGEKGFRWDQN